MKTTITVGTFTKKAFRDFKNSYYAAHPQPLRIGQAFCNTFNITNSRLFYMTSNEAALKYIYKHYLYKEISCVIL